MSESKHTPGPWEMNVGIDGAVVYHPDQGTIADVPMDLSAHPNNARVIAAAPELLEALEGLLAEVQHLERDYPEDYNFKRYRDVLAKAKGTL